jgi:hypothetical protein
MSNKRCLECAQFNKSCDCSAIRNLEMYISCKLLPEDFKIENFCPLLKKCVR